MLDSLAIARPSLELKLPWFDSLDSMRMKASSWFSHSKLFDIFSLPDIYLNYDAFISPSRIAEQRPIHPQLPSYEMGSMSNYEILGKRG